jgi:hypothetical protein
MTDAEVNALLAKMKPVAMRGVEPFNKSSIFDATAANPEWLGEEPQHVRQLMQG